MIGAGAAGLSITNVAARLGLRVALIERARMGGDCLNAGCVPSKALLAAGHAAQAARRAGQYGVRLPDPEVDWDGVRAHVGRAIAAIAPADSEERYRALGATVLRADATLTGPRTVEAGGRRLTARRIVLATGSRPVVPPIPGLDRVPHLTNETLFELAERPGHLLILGGGPVGLEMAQAHAGLGCRVTVVQAGRVAPREDAELAALLRNALTAEGVAVRENARVASVEPGPVLVLQDGERIAGTHLLVAAGRRPILDGLGLEAAGVRATPDGITTDRGLRSLTNRRVFAAGDVADPEGVGPRYFTHVGSYHAGVLVRRMLFRLPARVDYAALPRVIYTDPELAQVGLTEEEARDAGHAPEVHRWPLAKNDRAVAEGRTAGVVKLVVGRRGKLLGAGILAPHAGEMLGACTLAITGGASVRALAGMTVPYPTRSEAVKRAAGELYAPKLFSGASRRAARLLARLP